MKKPLTLTLLALASLFCARIVSAQVTVGDSPAFSQAGAIQNSGGDAIFDNNPSRGGVRVSQADPRSPVSDPCTDDSCGFRKGGAAPSSLKKEPKSPFSHGDKDADKPKKKGSGFNWMGLVMIGVGAAGGALAGFLSGGPIGAIVGAVLGGLLGWLAPKLMH